MDGVYCKQYVASLTTVVTRISDVMYMQVVGLKVGNLLLQWNMIIECQVPRTRNKLLTLMPNVLPSSWS